MSTKVAPEAPGGTLYDKPMKEISSQLDNSRMMKHMQFTEMTCVVVKSSPSDSLGLSMGKKGDGSMIITKIKPDSLVAQQTKLSVGDIIIAVNKVGVSSFTDMNDIQYPGLTSEQVGALLKMNKTISIRAKKPTYKFHRTVLTTDNMTLVETVLTKDNVLDPMGVTISKHDQGYLYISKTKEGGLATRQHSGLRPGYRILSINGKERSSVKEAGEILKNSMTVTIRAQRRTFDKGQMVKTTVTKATPSTPLGMTLCTSATSQAVELKAIKHGSLVYHTGLQSGMTLLSVGGFQCHGKSVAEVQAHIATLPEGPVIIRCQAN